MRFRYFHEISTGYLCNLSIAPVMKMLPLVESYWKAALSEPWILSDPTVAQDLRLAALNFRCSFKW